MIWTFLLDLLLKLLEMLLKKDPAELTKADMTKLNKIKKLVSLESFKSFGNK